MECRGFAVDAEWVTAMVAGWLGDGYGGGVWLAFGTGEDLLVYGMDAWYGRDIRYRKPPPTVRNCASVIAFYDVWKEATGCSLQGHN